jgi:aerobic C4-dicarboxylate transport protein
LGVDRFMGQCRAATNFIGNGVVALAVARWEKELDHRSFTLPAMREPEPETAL